MPFRKVRGSFRIIAVQPTGPSTNRTLQCSLSSSQTPEGTSHWAVPSLGGWFPWFPLLMKYVMWALISLSAALGLGPLRGVETPHLKGRELCRQYHWASRLEHLLQELHLSTTPFLLVYMLFLQCSLEICPLSYTSLGFSS